VKGIDDSLHVCQLSGQFGASRPVWQPESPPFAVGRLPVAGLDDGNGDKGDRPRKGEISSKNTSKRAGKKRGRGIVNRGMR